MNLRNIIYFTLCNESDLKKMDLIRQKQIKTKYRVIADKISRQFEPQVSLQTAESLYPTCDKIFHKNAFIMVEDYLDAGYYDEARNELDVMIDILKHNYPDRDESLHYNDDLTRVAKKSSLSN